MKNQQLKHTTTRWNKNLNLLLLTIITNGFLLTGCSTQTTIPDVVDINEHKTQCTIPNSKKLNSAINHSKKVLYSANCHVNFMDHFQANLVIAAEDPAVENLDKIAKFTLWAVDQGYISVLKSKEILSRHFNPKFVSLDYDDDLSTYSTCSLKTQHKQMQNKLTKELKQKHLGIYKALGDKATYQRIEQEKHTITLVLENTIDACQQGYQ